MTSPATHAEGLRVLWLLASRGVSATWDGTTVAIMPPDRVADGAIEVLETVLRPDADGRSHLQRARERHAPFLQEVKAARPPDVNDEPWRRAIEGLESFLLSGWGDEAERCGWSEVALHRVPPVWARIELCGVALLIADREVVAVTPTEIRIKTASGASQGFYRAPAIDYAVAYRAHLLRSRCETDAGNQEAELRALEHCVRLYLEHHPGCNAGEARARVLAAIKSPAP
jgi:hypothetical protein